ncbi:hypothetical protein KY285_001967 [Solanum tuberosum]|nr:hypothetical protein KY285_001967 [Solanum tuberosum]
MEEENSTEFLQRFWRDRRILLNFILSGSLIKKVVIPPGAVSLDEVDLDQVILDFFLNCAKKGELLELSEAIRDYHDNTLFPHMLNSDLHRHYFLFNVPEVYLLQHRIIPYATNPELSGLPPGRLPVPISTSPILRTLSTSTQQQELAVDNIEDFDDDDDLDEVDSRRYSRRVLNDVADLVLGLPSFATAIGDDDLRETAYEILMSAAGPSGSVKHVGGGAHKSSCYRVGESGRKANELRVLLAKIEESELQLRVGGLGFEGSAHALTYTASPTLSNIMHSVGLVSF